MIFFDTSALLVLYIQRKNSGEIIDFLHDNQEPVRIWSLTEVELHTATSQMVQGKEITSHQRESIKLSFISDTSEGIVLLDKSLDFHAVHKTAIAMSDRNGFSSRALDALHIAAAKVMGATTFVTSDHQQLYTARKEGFKVFGDS